MAEITYTNVTNGSRRTCLEGSIGHRRFRIDGRWKRDDGSDEEYDDNVEPIEAPAKGRGSSKPAPSED